MRSSVKLSLSALASALLLGACGGSSYGPTVKTAANSSLGATVLIDQRGLTLYRLSGEQAGNVICTAACLKVWHPLTVSAGARPSGGVRALGVLKRPDGKQQVTYKGMPLYTFVQDHSPGQINGQGIMDVGTWNAVSTGAATSATSQGPSPPAPYGGGGSAY